MELITLTEGIKPDQPGRQKLTIRKKCNPCTSCPKKQAGRAFQSQTNETRSSFISNWKTHTQKTAWDSTFSHFVFINVIFLKVHVLNIDFSKRMIYFH